MAARKVMDATNSSTGELIYFKGHAKATFLSSGSSVEDSINKLNNDIATFPTPQKGEKGDPGEVGPQGPQGPQGLQGNSGFTGTGLELVNNLTQGGATAALSAEQGMILSTTVYGFRPHSNVVYVNLDYKANGGGGAFERAKINDLFHNGYGGYVELEMYISQTCTCTRANTSNSAILDFGVSNIGANSNGQLGNTITGSTGTVLQANESTCVLSYKGTLESSKYIFIRSRVQGQVKIIYRLGVPSEDGLVQQVDSNTQRLNAVTGSVNGYDSRIATIESQLKSYMKTGDLTQSVKNGIYTYSSTTVGSVATVTFSSNGAWRCIEQSVKAGEKYIVTGTGGGGARLYCLMNNSNVIKVIAGSGEVQSNLVLSVEEDGKLYCSFDNNFTYQLLRQYFAGTDFKAIWENGSYEFGKLCNFDYTAPTIGSFNLPSTGKINTIYSWYNGLVSAYPNYVSRENCDTVMSSLGVTKPSSLSSWPMYIYKFSSPKTPNASAYSTETSSANRIKAFILTGTHNEETSIWDCYNAMKLVCEKWTEDKNLEELRWNADIYIIPCYNLYGVENSTRTNENGVDLNRNAPTSDWTVQGALGDSTYSGTSGGSEYSTKVMMHYLSTIKPQVFIDHHTTNVGSGTSEGDGKNLIYTLCKYQIGIDIANAVISQMTRKWKMRYTDTFPSVENDNVMFGYTEYDTIKGSIAKYASEKNCLGSVYESNFGTLYKNGVYSTSNRQTNTPTVNTCATEGFINYLLRCLGSYSQFVGVNALN